MRIFLDTNVLLATILEDAERVDESTQLLDRSDLEFVTSAVNVKELRAALTKKQGLERDGCEGIVRDIVADVDVYLPDSGDLADAVELQPIPSSIRWTPRYSPSREPSTRRWFPSIQSCWNTAPSHPRRSSDLRVGEIDYEYAVVSDSGRDANETRPPGPHRPNPYQ